MKRKFFLITTLALAIAVHNLQAQPYNVTVNTTATPPVNPVISQYVASGNINASLLYNLVGAGPLQVYVQGRIECLSPSPFTISVNPAFAAQGMITLTPGIPTQMTATQMLGAFGFFNDANLVATGVSLSSLKDANNNILLPPGNYRICFVARQPDAASGLPGPNASDPNLGCASFTVQNTQPPNGVTINTVVIPPVLPAINTTIQNGNVRPAVQYTVAGAGNTQVKVFGKIERLSPSPFTINVAAGYVPQQTLTLTSGVPLQMTASQVMDALGNLTQGNLALSGISWSGITDGNNNIQLPDGNYRICFYAKYISPTGGVGGNASDPSLGCATFNILNTQPPNGVTINTVVIPPVLPAINTTIQNGNVRPTVQYTVAGAGNTQVKVFGKIERLSPSPFTINVAAGYVPQQTLTLTPGVPLQMTASQVMDALGNLTQGNLALSGISWSGITDGNNNIQLPDGNYRICFYAKYISPTGGVGGNASDPSLGCATFNILNTQPPNGVTINTVVIPPAPSLFNQYILRGNVKTTLRYNFAGAGNTQVKVFGKIERLTPSPFTIDVNAAYIPHQTLTLTSGVSYQMSVDQILDALGNLNQSDLTLSGIEWSDIANSDNTLRLPDGTYRICFYAKYVSQTGGLGGNASDPSLGCATFGICASASAPQFTQPVSNFNIKNNLPAVQRTSPVVFAWTPPGSTCGGQLGTITYELEIHELLQGQTPTDAINNPPVFIRRQLPSTTFLLDTNLYKNVLQNGKRYAIRVRALPPAGIALTQKIENNGFSRVEVFQYGGDTSSIINPPGNEGHNNPPTVLPPVKNGNENNNANNEDQNKDEGKKKDEQVVNVYDSTADCGIKLPADSTKSPKGTDLSNKVLTIGQFKLTPTTITQNTDSSFTGTGTIDWKPLSHTIKLAVSFKNIQVNKNDSVFAGVVTTSKDSKISLSKSFASFKDYSGQTAEQLDQMAERVENFLKQYPGGQLVSQIATNSPVSFPIGLDNQNIGGTPVTLAIMNMTFSPKGATMSVLLNINVPDANGWLSLAGTGFCLSPTGVSFAKGTLLLPVDHHFNFGTDKDSLDFAFKGCPTADSTNGTYVSWENGSLSDIVANVKVAFPRNTIVAEDKDGNPKDSVVNASMNFKFKKWDDWIASLTFDNFQLPGVKGLGFHPGTMYYDHSSVRNPNGFDFPKNYTGFSGNDFEGLYIKDMKVLLPSDFKTFNQGKERTMFDAKDLIIDSKGVSFNLLGTHIIDQSTGDLGGWAFSLDTVRVQMQKNTFTDGSFKGKIQLPISKTPLDYLGDLHVGKDTVTGKDSSLQYAFVIVPSDNMEFDIWAAKVQLNKNSSFKVQREKDGTLVSFILNGTIGIDIGSSGLNLPGLKFDSLGIANRNPKTNEKKFWFSPGTWNFSGGSNSNSSSFIVPANSDLATAFGPNVNTEPDWKYYASGRKEPDDDGSDQGKLSGFPVSINNVKPYTDFSDMSNLKIGVQFDLNVNVGLGDASVVSATTKLAVYGEINAAIQNMAPQISLSAGVDIDSIAIKGDVGPVNVNGMLVFYKHDITFGDGVKGHISAMFPMLQTAIEATAQFGNVNNFNYWYIDACATFPTIPVVGPIGINGFGGGAYYNMKMQGNLPPDPYSLQASTVSKNATPGTTMSGVSFVPEKESAGIRATVGIALVSGAGADAMNAKITLTAGIANGALSQLGLHGEMYVMTNSPVNDKATVQGVVDIVYDLSQNKFSLAAEVKGKFGTIVVDVPLGIYSGPDGWYLKVGDAYGQRATFQLVDDSTSIYVLRIGANAYLGLGSLINPSLPPLPDKLSAFGVQRSPQVDALINQLDKTKGDGMMFGAQVNGTLKFSLAFLYANLDATLGFDLALKHFLQNFQCGGTSAGWENWYALGQIYFYFNVDVGVHVDCFLGKGDFSLVSFTAGGVLTAGLPNPTWLDGSIHVKGEIFDGLISVDQDAHFTIGEKCYPTSSPLSDINIISSYGPQTKGDVFDAPYVASNVGLGVNYDVQAAPSKNYPDGEMRTFRFEIASYTLTEGSNSVNNIHLVYQNNNTTGIIKHDLILKPQTNYTVTVVCSAMQFYPQENRWDNPLNDENNQREPYRQTVTWSFKTGDAPGYIPDQNVHFLYPVNNQRYVLKQEMNGNGKIELGQWQPNILSNSSNSINMLSRGGGFDYKLFFIPVGSTDTVKSTFTADESSRTLNYQIPATLKNNTVYRAEFWSFPKEGINLENLKVLSKVSMSTRTMNVQNVGNASGNTNIKAQIKQTTVTGPVKMAEAPRPIYVLNFATSQYNSLTEKLNGMGQWAGVKKGDIMWINAQNVPAEKFDEYEVKGFKAPDGTAYPPLFSAQIDWNNSQQNDQFASDNLYAPALTLAFKGVQTNLSVSELREMIYRPVRTLDWSGFAYSPPLSLAETTPALIYQALTANRQVPNASLGGVINNASKSNSISAVSSGGFSFSFSQPAAASVGSSRFNSIGSMSTINVTMPMPYSLKWSRDYYLHQDYNLLNAFGLVAQTQAAIIQHQLSPSQAEDLLSNMSGDINFVSNNIGGTVTMPWNKFYYLYTDPNSVNILNKLKNLQFASYPHGSRNITFRYGAGSMQGNAVNKTFNY